MNTFLTNTFYGSVVYGKQMINHSVVTSAIATQVQGSRLRGKYQQEPRKNTIYSLRFCKFVDPMLTSDNEIVKVIIANAICPVSYWKREEGGREGGRDRGI